MAVLAFFDRLPSRRSELEDCLRRHLLAAADAAAQLLPPDNAVSLQEWVECRMPDELHLGTDDAGLVVLLPRQAGSACGSSLDASRYQAAVPRPSAKPLSKDDLTSLRMEERGRPADSYEQAAVPRPSAKPLSKDDLTSLRMEERGRPADSYEQAGWAYGASPDASRHQAAERGRSRSPPPVEVSKALARILRHSAQKQGIRVNDDGYCKVSDILELPEFVAMRCAQNDVQAVVAGNKKKRFEMKTERSEAYVRAVQGHSMESVRDDLLLTRLHAGDSDLPEVCVHGTYWGCLKRIRRNGLVAGGGGGNRNHVHFQPFPPDDDRVVSGFRKDCQAAVYIDLRRALRDGIPFYRSANDVILSPGIGGVISPEYILKMQNLHPNW